MATETISPKKPGRPPIPRDGKINRAIRDLLQKSHVSEKELARRIKVNQANVNRWVQAADVEFGKSVGPALAQLPMIEDALGEPRGTLYAMAYGHEVVGEEKEDSVQIVDFGEMLMSTIKLVTASIGGNLSASLAESINDLIRLDDTLEPEHKQMVISTIALCRDLSSVAKTRAETKETEQLSFAGKPSSGPTVGALLKHAS